MYPKEIFSQKTYVPKRCMYPKDIFTQKKYVPKIYNIIYSKDK